MNNLADVLQISARFTGNTRAAPTVLALSLFSFVIGCSDPQKMDWPSTLSWVQETFPEVSQMSTAEFAELLAESEMPLVIDTRSLEEFQVSHIPNACHARTAEEALELIQQLQAKSPVVLYCSVGYRSSEMASRLEKSGVDGVYNLEGSIFKWANEGRDIVSHDGRAQKVHPYDRNWAQLLNQELRGDL